MSKLTLLNDNAEVLQLSVGGGAPGCSVTGDFLNDIKGLSGLGKAIAILQPDLGGPDVAAAAQGTREFIDSIKAVLC